MSSYETCGAVRPTTERLPNYDTMLWLSALVKMAAKCVRHILAVARHAWTVWFQYYMPCHRRTELVIGHRSYYVCVIIGHM